jgi:hypothetical protein
MNKKVLKRKKPPVRGRLFNLALLLLWFLKDIQRIGADRG